MFRAIVPTALALFLSIALSGASGADFVFQTPAGVSPGQSFNVVFFDSIGDGATSTNIADYNAAITSAASGINYSGGTIGSWSIIGATSTADGSAGLFGSNLPVYDLRGNVLASTGGGYQSSGLSPSIDQSGALFPAYPVWTGLISLGIPGNSQYALGGGEFPSYGLSGYSPPAAGWGGLLGGPNEDTYSPANIRGLYGYAVFTSSAPLRGDFNGDGRVDVADIFAMSSALADLESYKSATGFNDADVVALGDFDGDGVVTNADLQGLINLLANGGGSGAGSLMPVPEPSSLALITLALISAIAARPAQRPGVRLCSIPHRRPAHEQSTYN